MAYQCGSVIVELIPDDGIEREGKICSGYYGRVYESERAVENDDYIDDFCIALGHELTAGNARGIREALAHYFDLPVIRIREMEEERQENQDMNDRNFVKFIKEQYPPGTRIRLNSMEDPYAPIAPGTEGEVDFVDDIGQLHMKWDNGRTLALVPGEDSFSVLPPKLTMLKLYMPLTADLFEPNEYGDMDECSELLEGHELRDYQDQITAALVKNRMPEETERGLMHWYGKADNIDKKVHSAVFTVESRSRQLWGVAECRVAGELSQEELSTLKEFITGQASDGWGEGSEQREIRVDGGCELYIHFWNSDEWSIQTEQELFAPKLVEGLPDLCFSVLASTGALICIKRGESGYYPSDWSTDDPAQNRELADYNNERLGVTQAQRLAMECGSMHGWGVPGADPGYYEQKMGGMKFGYSWAQTF